MTLIFFPINLCSDNDKETGHSDNGKEMGRSDNGKEMAHNDNGKNGKEVGLSVITPAEGFLVENKR